MQPVDFKQSQRVEVAKVARRPGEVAPKEAETAIQSNQETRKNSQEEEPDPHAAGTKLGSYVFDKSLGKGTFGKVKLATHTLTNEHVSWNRAIALLQVAIKILEKARIKDKKDIERISREIKILKKVRHPNVVQLYEVSIQGHLFITV